MTRATLTTFNRNLRIAFTLRGVQLALAMVGTAALTTFVLYLTPLHYLNMVEPPMRDVDPTAIYQKMQVSPQKYLFVDVRPSAVYAKEHAVGAINIPLPQLYSAHYQLPKHGKTIVLICGDGKAAGVAFGYLEHFGFLNTVRIEGGLTAWLKGGLPTEKLVL